MFQGTEVAIKIVHADFFDTKPSISKFQSEIKLLTTLHHPNIILFMGTAAQTEPSLEACIVMELMPYNLYNILHDLPQWWQEDSYLSSSASVPRSEMHYHENHQTSTIGEIFIREKLNILRSIAKGMNYLHTRNPAILHRDLKSVNILCGPGWRRGDQIKISDFGISQKIHPLSKLQSSNHSSISNSHNNNNNNNKNRNNKKNISASSPQRLKRYFYNSESSGGGGGGGSESVRDSCIQEESIESIGTACWAAPEVIEHGTFSEKSDVYSFGIVFWEVMTREELYDTLGMYEVLLKVVEEDLRPEIFDYIPDWGKLIMEECWKKTPSARPSFGQVLERLETIARNRNRELNPDTECDGMSVYLKEGLGGLGGGLKKKSIKHSSSSTNNSWKNFNIKKTTTTTTTTTTTSTSTLADNSTSSEDRISPATSLHSSSSININVDDLDNDLDNDNDNDNTLNSTYYM